MRTLLIGEKYKNKLEMPLISNGFLPFWLPKNINIDVRLASHADLSVFIYKKTVILASYLADEPLLVNFLTNKGYKVMISEISQYSDYPGDINLCAALLGNKIIHNSKYTDPNILSLGLDCINVKQAYSRCTALTLNETALITADKGVAYAAKNDGAEVLIINNNGIELDGFDKGFIGGASFKTEDTIYFTGDIEKHPSANIIKDFIKKHGFKICCLTSEPLFDIGGAICIK